MREQIDQLDAEIVKLLNRRLDIASKIGAHKKDCNLAILDNAREQTVLEKIKLSTSSDKYKYISEIYRTIFEVSKELQQTND